MSSNLTVDTFSTLTGDHSSVKNIWENTKRLYAEVGLDLIGTFEEGCTVTNSSQIVLHAETGKGYSWGGSFNKVIPKPSTPETTGGISAGAWVDRTDLTLRGELSQFTGSLLVGGGYTAISTVGEMLSESSARQNSNIVTLKNQHNIDCISIWKISASQIATTYSLALSNGLYANLILERSMSYAAFGFGSSSPSANSAAIDEACRVARANTVIEELRFPAGTFYSNQINLDVDRRGFTFTGPGYDMSYIYSMSDNLSLVLVGLDPRDRSKDAQHFYQKVNGFTIDGNITNRGASAAQRTAIVAPYAEVDFKSVGHRVSNIDFQSLSSRGKVHTQGRTNGAISSQNSVRTRNNALDICGYIGGSSGFVSLSVNGPDTTLSSSASIGDDVVHLTSSAGLVLYDTIEILGGTLEAKRITAISGNDVTLDSALSNAHSAGGKVSVPVNGVDVDAIFETGQVQVGTCSAVDISGSYAEGSEFYVYGYPNGLHIGVNTISEANPSIQIDQVNRNSVIAIDTNTTYFPIAINVKDRGGNINSNIDLYNFPMLKIDKCSRGQQGILVNGVYAFSSINVTRTYDSILSDRAFTRFDFTGLFHSVAATFTTDALTFGMFPALTGTNSDGYAFDIDVVCRRSTTVLAGLLKRAGTASVFSGSTPYASNTSISSNYNQYNSTTGVDVVLAATASVASISAKGEPSGGQTTRFAIDGAITHVF